MVQLVIKYIEQMSKYNLYRGGQFYLWEEKKKIKINFCQKQK